MDLQNALDATNASDSFYRRAESYNDGTVSEKFSSPAFARLVMGSANRFRLNYARVPVSALCNRIKISSFEVTGEETASEYLSAVWLDNQMGNLSQEVHTKAASAGSSYLLAWPDPDDDTAIDVSICDPRTTRVYYSPENPRKALYASRRWLEGKATRVNLYYPDRIEKYITKPGAKGNVATGFVPYYDLFEETVDAIEPVSTPVWPIPNPWNKIPIFHFRDGAGYGRPVNRDAWEPQDALNKLASTMMATVDYLGFPQRYVTTNPTNDPTLDGSDNEFDQAFINTMPGANTTVEDGPQQSLKSGPGGLWFLNADDVGQFDAAEMSAFLEPMEQYIKAISTTTGTPLHAFQGMGDAPSGESLRAANAPLTDNVRNVEGWFQPTWVDFMNFLLALGGYENSKATMTWANPDMADDKEFWTTVTTKIEAGVPRAQALLEAGYSQEQVDTWKVSTDSTPSAPKALADA